MEWFMKKSPKLLAICSSVIFLSACSSAKKSNEVSAAYVPASNYSSKTCEQLVADAEGVRRAIPGLEQAVDSHRSQQTGVEVITWLFFWPAAFALDKGESQSTQLATARGELEAIRTAMAANKCGN
jgi:hypothetical protein